MPVRLKDIANDLGLSVVTISKVLRNHPDIGKETRKRVLKRMKELNYRPNLAARSLITGRTFTIGLVVPDLLHPFFAQVAQGISDEVRQQGFGLILCSSDDDPELEREEIEHLLSRRVDVMLLASVQSTAESFRRIEEQKTPYVLFDRRLEGVEANFVGVDDREVGLLATTHLIEQGCRRVAHVCGSLVSTATGRLEGYQKALTSHGFEPHPEDVVSIGISGDHRGERGGYEATMKLLANPSRPDGIFCFNDPVAIGAMRAILDSGLRVPQDVAIVGCGNLSYSDFLRVPLSSVDQGSEMIGKRAAALALKLAQKNRAPLRQKTELVPLHLVARASSLRSIQNKQAR